MFYAGFDLLFSILFPILFFVVLGMILYTFIRNIRTWNQNNHSPRLTVPAKVVAKRTEVSHHHTDNTMIQILWLFSMLLLVVRKIEKDRVWNFCSKAPVWSILMLTIVVYGSAQVLNTPVVTVYRFGIYGFCFFAGYFLFSHEEVMERLCKWWWMFDAASAVLGISYTLRYFGENYAIAPVLNNIHACVYCWFAILGILTTMRNYADISNVFTHWMTKKSWGLYIFHYLPIAVISYELHEHAPDTPEVLVYLLVGIGAFVGAFLLNELISRIPILRWCVLGIKKEKNHVSR